MAPSLAPSRWRVRHILLGTTLLAATCNGQTGLTWEEVRERFKRNNPDLAASQLLTRESRANEITAGLKPNPVFSSSDDQIRLFNGNPYRPLGAIQFTQSFSQLHERRRKRELRVESARLASTVADQSAADLERQLTFVLRGAFVQVLQQKAVLELAEENLKSYDRVIALNRERRAAGDIARIDLSRIELQRAQFESDLANARVGLRTAKIQLLALLNERQSPDGFEVTGPFEFRPLAMSRDGARSAALDSRPDLRAALTGIEKAKVDNRLAWANGSTDPTWYVDYTRAGPDNTIGMGFSIPLRLYDRNQGEKARTAIEIERAARARSSVEAGIYRDVDSAFEALQATAGLITAFRDSYLKQSADVRDTVSFAYAHGGASLLDFLDAQKSYRDTQLSYRNLIAAYLSAANQLSFAVGQEVNP